MNATIRPIALLGLALAAEPLSVPWAATPAVAAPPLKASDFRILDRNGDGKLSLAEAKGNADLELNFETLDRNHDGVLTQEEFGQAAVPSDPSTAPGGSAGAQHMPKS